MRICIERNDAGFTLIEIMVAIAIAAIVVSLAITQLQPQLDRSRTKSVARQLRADLQNAKLEAIKRNTSCLVEFTVAAGANSGTCRICISADNDCDDAGADIMISQLDLNDYTSVELQSADFSGSANFVFTSRGMPEQIGGGIAMGNAVINCTTDASYSLQLLLAPGGRIRIQ